MHENTKGTRNILVKETEETKKETTSGNSFRSIRPYNKRYYILLSL